MQTLWYWATFLMDQLRISAFPVWNFEARYSSMEQPQVIRTLNSFSTTLTQCWAIVSDACLHRFSHKLLTLKLAELSLSTINEISSSSDSTGISSMRMGLVPISLNVAHGSLSSWNLFNSVHLTQRQASSNSYGNQGMVWIAKSFHCDQITHQRLIPIIN